MSKYETNSKSKIQILKMVLNFEDLNIWICFGHSALIASDSKRFRASCLELFVIWRLDFGAFSAVQWCPSGW